MVSVKKYEGYMLAKSTIHHGGNEKTGSSPILRTIYMYVDGKGEMQIPYINGNAIRGKLRRLVMREFLKLADIDPEVLGEKDTKIYHTFFTGGALTATEDSHGSINLALRKDIRKLLIPLNLFGCALGNQMIHGKLKVGHAFPICREYKIYLPDDLQNDERTNMSVRSFTDESFQTRKDDLKAEREQGEQAVQMKVDFECFIPGTKFYHWFALEYPSQLEESCFGNIINIFKASPFIGAMSSTGNGEVIFDYGDAIESDQEYIEFVLNNKDKIQEFIESISSML